MMKDLWQQITQSEYPWEREALDYLKRRLPDHEPYRAWANFEFLLGGVLSEVDVLVAVPKGLFLVEIKNWPGRIDGDAGTWRWTRPGSTTGKTLDNPYLLANRKAKRLKSLLARQKAFRNEVVPFVAPLVFLSSPELDCRLVEEARHGVVGLDPDENGERPQRGGLHGVVTHLTSLSREEAQALGQRRIDRPTSTRIAQGLEQAGIRPVRHNRTVGDLQLRELLDEGSGYQDFLAVHPRFPNIQHRARIYATPDVATPQEREQAARAAEREYALLHAVDHPGIVTAQSFQEHELGPVIVFERDPTEVRLDQFLAEAGSTLDLDARLALIREIAEALAYAHGQRLFHRALSPRCVLVSSPDKPAARRCRLISWQTGARSGGDGSIASVTGTQHLEDLVDEAGAAYLAPESFSQLDADPQLLDVFSLGTLAYLIFSDQPPARTRAELVQTLSRTGSLEIAGALDGAGSNLGGLVREASRSDATQRCASVADFLVLLDCVEEEATAPDATSEEGVAPAAATVGDVLAGFTVKRRLGRGSTAVALLVTTEEGTERVLKVAADPERNPRILAEGEVLTKLNDSTIITLYGTQLDLDGYAALLLAYASHGTLAERIRHDGRLPIDTLERWGEDLLTAIAYLEAQGISHRDIKPDNLGVIEHAKSRERHLVLFDFSLARAPADQLTVGTRPYLDPFLGQGTRRRYDLAADRWSATIVLHEMATGQLPSWGSDPVLAVDELAVEGDAMPRELAAPLVTFFTRAFRRDSSKRFDTAEEMLRSWRQIFETVTTATDERPEERREERELALARATHETPVAVLGLSPQGLDTLERIGVLTVADLLRSQPFRLNRIRGVGVDTRRSLVDARRTLLSRLGPPEPQRQRGSATPTTAEEAPDVERLDELVAQLLPRETSRNRAQVAGLGALLGLDADLEVAGYWPSQSEVAARFEVSRARIAQINGQGRDRWRRLKAVTRLREELRSILDRLGGVAGVTELEAEIAGTWGAEDETQRGALARAAVRAAVEVEQGMEAPRFRTRRTADRVLIASAGATLEERQAVLEYAVRLGTAADVLAGREPLASSAEVSASLSAVRTPDAVAGLTIERLIRVAAYASSGAAVSGQLELYPRGMAAERALRLARGALHGAERLNVDELNSRVTARFPETEPLPARPELDKLLDRAGLELRWDDQQQAYRPPERRALTEMTSYLSSSLTRLPTAAVMHMREREEPEVLRAREFEERLQAATREGGLLYLCTVPTRLAAARRELRRFGVHPVDADAAMLRALRDSAHELNVSWELVLNADAADRTDVNWSRLSSLVARSLTGVEAALGDHEGIVLIENPGLLARYGQISLLERLRERILAGGPPRGVWVLVPADWHAGRPVLDGVSLPTLTTNEALEIPPAWLANRHRADPHIGQAA
jgi:serine/threonine protein kinase